MFVSHKHLIKFGSQFIDDVVTGFIPTQIRGRELMSNELAVKTIEGLDGESLLYSQLPARDIEVTYKLHAPSPYMARQRFNTLQALLREKQVQLIFADEPDKYFIATVSTCDETTITFHCTDPFKYSVTEKSFLMEDGKITIQNDGTMPCPVRYQIYHNNHDNGYIGIASQYGAMEFGKREELDGETYKQNETLVTSTTFFNTKDDGSSGKDYLASSHSSYNVSGSLQKITWNGNDYLALKSVSGTSAHMNGGVRTVTIPADSSGAKGAKDFYCWHRALTWCGQMGQTGEMSLVFLTDDNKPICGYNWYKDDASGNTGHYECWINGKMVKSYSYTWNANDSDNPYSPNRGPNDITKTGDKVQFYFFGQYPTFSDSEIKDMVCTKIQISIKQYGARSGDRYVSTLGLGQLTFQKMGVEGYRDIPNRYRVGTLCIADGTKGSYTVDGQPKPNDEVLGTQYFMIPSGETEVQMNFSSFCTPAPTVRAYIRERWL